MVELARRLQEAKADVQRRDRSGGFRGYCAAANGVVVGMVVVFHIPTWDLSMLACIRADEQAILPRITIAIGQGPGLYVDRSAGEQMVIDADTDFWRKAKQRRCICISIGAVVGIVSSETGGYFRY